MKKSFLCLIIFLFIAVFISLPANAQSSLAGIWKQIEDHGVTNVCKNM